MTTVAADQERKAPGRPRSAKADEAIIEALLDLLADGTPAEAISIESVAAKAGVGKATIYRRWANKEALLVDADGLNAFAGRGAELASRTSEAVITPHPGEFGRLVGMSSGEVVEDRVPPHGIEHRIHVTRHQR